MEMRISLGVDSQGNRIRKSVYGKTQRQVIQAARQLQQEWDEGRLDLPGEETTVAQYFESRLEHKRFEIEPRTGTPYWFCGSGSGHSASSLMDIKSITFHDLRHTVASRMIARGKDPVKLARVLGHSDFATRTYAHSFEKVNERPYLVWGASRKLLGVQMG